MAIVGLGVDVVEIQRVSAALGRTPGLRDRLYTAGEQARCSTARGEWHFPRLAARFAAKEAVAKALGTGIAGFGWCDIEISNDDRGMPLVRLHGGAAARAAELGVHHVHLSMSTSDTVAVASAVAES